MSKQKPTYFLAPPRPYPPDGPIRLGSIIVSPTQPDEPLYTPALPSSTDVSTFTERNWSASHTLKKSSEFGIWTKFLQVVLGVGVDAGVHLDNQVRQSWQVENMTTMSFHPSDAFIRSSVAADEVRNYLIGNYFREKVYLVTGVMIAKSTKAFRETLEEKGVYIHAGVDATAWTGVPISVGPDGKWMKKEEVQETSETEEEFVFAFRLREIKVKRKGGDKGHKVYDKGALFDIDRGTVVLDAEEIWEMEIEGLGDEPEGDEFGLDVEVMWQEEGDEGEEEFLCVLPEEQ